MPNASVLVTCCINSLESAESTNSLSMNKPVGTVSCLSLRGMEMVARLCIVEVSERVKRRYDTAWRSIYILFENVDPIRKQDLP